MTAVARPPRSLAAATTHSRAQPRPYVGRHRDDRRARHSHAAAAVLALMLAWIPAAAAARGRHRRL